MNNEPDMAAICKNCGKSFCDHSCMTHACPKIDENGFILDTWAETFEEANTEVENLKAHLALACQLFRATCDVAGLDLSGTKMEISIGENKALSKSLDEMIKYWEEISK
jgi:hypothetical protein